MNRQGYDIELENDDLYPKRSHTSVRRYSSVEERDAQQPQQQQRTVLRSRPQHQLRHSNQYDNVNVFVRRTSAPRTSSRPQPTVAPRPAQQPRHAAPVQDEDDELKTEPLRTTSTTPPPKHQQKQRWRLHWLVPVGVGMVVMVLLLFLLWGFLNWWDTTQDDWHYGRPRTAQYDVAVGHHDSAQNPSHFIALNLHRHIEIIELPGGDATKAKVYLGPTLIGDHEDLTPVTLEFKALKSDGKLDMIVHVGDNKVVFINANGQFRLVQPGDNITTV